MEKKVPLGFEIVGGMIGVMSSLQARELSARSARWAKEYEATAAKMETEEFMKQVKKMAGAIRREMTMGPIESNMTPEEKHAMTLMVGPGPWPWLDPVPLTEIQHLRTIVPRHTLTTPPCRWIEMRPISLMERLRRLLFRKSPHG